ncbi:hypothetical protein ACLBKS_02205 [Hylemonella sp. W303a]|uniref:hypothetical protein n=1 Tax=Hylemonella sp. W303a TaxID=3389873 RepID=UPI00396B17AA
MTFGPISISLVTDWRQAPKFHSLWAAGALLIFSMMQYMFAPFSQGQAALGAGALVLLFIGLRYYKASNQRVLWRASSVIASALLAVLSMLQSEILPLAQPLVPAEYWPHVLLAFGIAIPVLRMVKQATLHAYTDESREPNP